MAGPLTLLGDAISGGARDYMQLRVSERQQDKARKQQLEDRATERSQRLEDNATDRRYQLEDRSAAQTYEQKIYDARRADAMLNDLVASGVLNREDMANPEAIKAALKRTGVEYTQAAAELAGYKAALPKMVEAIGDGFVGADKLMAMTPKDIELARGLMADAYKALAVRVKSDYDKGVSNAKNASALIAANMAKANVLQGERQALTSEFERLQSGQPNEDETKAARAAALAARPDLAKAKPNTTAWQELGAEVQKQLQPLMREKLYRIDQRSRDLVRREQNVADEFADIAKNASSGAFAFLADPKAVATNAPKESADLPTTPAPAAGAGASDSDEVKAFIDPLSTKPAPDTSGAPTPPVTSAQLQGDAASQINRMREMHAARTQQGINQFNALSEDKRSASEAMLDSEFAKLTEDEQNELDGPRARRLRYAKQPFTATPASMMPAPRPSLFGMY